MYLAGFGNHHQSEAIAGALPQDQNSPQQCRFGLYAEQLSGSAFTRPRHVNLRSWLYRTLPSVVHEDYIPYEKPLPLTYEANQPPNPLRWQPLSAPSENKDFVDGLFHIAGNKSSNAFIYQCNQSMDGRYFSNSDGEFLFVPYLGDLHIHTEFGKLTIGPGKIAVIPRGVKFKVDLLSSLAAGYLCENSSSPLNLPQLGPIGANGLANPRHFLYPQAAFEHIEKEVVLICKYQHKFWTAKSNHSPLNVVAWHGNYAPYCYDLSLFNTINTVSFDHPDPSIFTVLTSESNTPGVANLDFVIFPPRWMVAEHTFRPPYFHRNIMNELMGLITGEYDAKKEGFIPGGVSIHNCMTAHGPDGDTYRSVIHEELKPTRYQNTLAFMFETRKPWLVSEQAFRHPAREANYSACWQSLPLNFQTP
ncbi:Homogentisate 1,2-dioxygenase [Legionella lansingensis]|uniref:Homogentisate 1,2-dioxygenase n=1 Tax=Legionella lansingensis TaxID=45067 RepID=A0A0W0VTE2_9GAMM|nr:homogentisate 1,2-dioxygenase [Legionella lansingensis]KTD23404.1 Homogentisate 1,2-dioxygenase [Legionella lansingensis]SNV49556.1 Homogentisate 1,2-dioxygenase [Legionella lansingensis]